MTARSEAQPPESRFGHLGARTGRGAVRRSAVGARPEKRSEAGLTVGYDMSSAVCTGSYPRRAFVEQVRLFSSRTRCGRPPRGRRPNGRCWNATALWRISTAAARPQHLDKALGSAWLAPGAGEAAAAARSAAQLAVWARGGPEQGRGRSGCERSWVKIGPIVGYVPWRAAGGIFTQLGASASVPGSVVRLRSLASPGVLACLQRCGAPHILSTARRGLG